MKSLIKYVLRRLAVRGNVKVGKDFHVGPGSILWAPTKLAVGNDVYVGKNVTIQVDGHIGDQVLIANSVGIVGKTDHDLSVVGTPIRSAPWVGDDPEQLSKPVRIGSDVWIGYGAIVLSGVSIGDSSVIAAGSVVTHDVEPNSVVAGSPATTLRRRFTAEEFETHWSALESQGLTRMVDAGEKKCESR
jgi:acetyltransferase-like isoleucine patch superfamily enzyme